MSTLSSSLIISLIDKVSAPARAVNAAVSGLTDAAKRNAAQMGAARGRMIDSAIAGYALAKSLQAPIMAAIDFESAMADIKKVVTFDTPEGFANLGKEIRRMARSDIPMAADGIAAIVAEAGQSGVAVKDLTVFADMAAKVSVAWETSAGETGKALAKLKTALKLSVAETGLLADAINYLGNNTAAGAPDILEFTRRVAPMAKTFGLSTEQAAAFGSAMIGSGFEAEVAATSFLNMGRALTKGSSASKRQSQAMKAVGLNSRKVAKAMQTDAVGTIKTVLAQINKLPDYRRASIISDIFGDEARALGPLINDADLLAKVLGLVGDKSEYAGSAQNEFNERSKTTANLLQMFKNKVTDLSISIGSALLPALNSIVTTVGPVVDAISDMATAYPQATTAIVAATAAIVGFRVATSAAAFAGLFMKGSLLQMSQIGVKSVGAATSAATASVGALSAALGIGSVSARKSARNAVANAKALVSQTSASYQSARTMMDLARSGQVAGVSVKQAATNLSAAGRAATSAQVGLKAANAAMLATSRTAAIAGFAVKALKVALISSGVGVAVVALGAAAAWIYNNWEGVTIAFEAFKGAFVSAIQPIMPMLSPVIDGVSSLVDWVSNLLGPVDAMGGGWARAGIAAGKFVGETLVTIASLPGKIMAGASKMWDAGVAMIQALWDGAVAKFDEFLAYVKEIPARIVAAIGRIDLSNIIKLPYVPSASSWGSGEGNNAFGGGTPTPGAPGAVTVDGAREKGGPVRSGKTYLVGEGGPELFSPGQSGMISPNDVYSAMSSAPAASQTSARTMGDVNIQISIPGMVVRSEADIDKILAELDKRLRDQMQGLHADMNYAAGV